MCDVGGVERRISCAVNVVPRCDVGEVAKRAATLRALDPKQAGFLEPVDGPVDCALAFAEAGALCDRRFRRPRFPGGVHVRSDHEAHELCRSIEVRVAQCIAPACEETSLRGSHAVTPPLAES